MSKYQALLCPGGNLQIKSDAGCFGRKKSVVLGAISPLSFCFFFRGGMKVRHWFFRLIRISTGMVFVVSDFVGGFLYLACLVLRKLYEISFFCFERSCCGGAILVALAFYLAWRSCLGHC